MKTTTQTAKVGPALARSMLDRLVPGVLRKDDEGLRMGRLVAGACVIVGSSSLGLAGGRFLVDPYPSYVGIAVLGIAVAAFAVLISFQRVPRPALMGTVLTCAGMMGACSMALMEGGLFSEGLYWALFVPLVTALFSGMRGSIGLAALGVVFMTVLLGMHLSGHDFGKGSADAMGMILHYSGLISALVFGALIGGLFEGNRISALETQRETEAHAAQLKDELISVVSHELRTPLTAIRGGLGLLTGGAGGEFDPRARELLDLSVRNAARLGDLINDLLDVQQLQRGGMEFHFERVSVAGAIEQAVELNLGYAQRSGVALGVIDEIPDVRVLVDASRLQQILANLISNAIKFSPQDESVELRAHVERGRVSIDVIDRGPGIPASAFDAVFERFRQVDASDQRAQSGSGLGLHIARGLALRMNGEIGVCSELGSGSVFTVTLPLATAESPGDPV